jgi:hypothetical protein
MVLVICIIVPITPQARGLLPVEQTLMLVVALIASCAVVGWRNGGSPWLALGWVLAAAAMIAWPRPAAMSTFGVIERGWAVDPSSPYAALARGWTLLLAACFGLVSLFSPTQPFISRALSTLALAAGLGFILVLVSPGGPARVSVAMTSEYSRRIEETMSQLHEAAALARPKDKRAGEDAERFNQVIEEQAVEISRSSSLLVPAILALESLAAMALAWSLYDRMGAVRIGPPLGRLRDFRFNDQLVWGVAVGASVFILPAFREGKNAGLNFLVFFGSLYVLRGLGILGWVSNGHIVRLAVGIALMSFLAVVVAYQLGFLIAFGAPLIALAFSLGLGDTWVDWRRLLQAKTG